MTSLSFIAEVKVTKGYEDYSSQAFIEGLGEKMQKVFSEIGVDIYDCDEGFLGLWSLPLLHPEFWNTDIDQLRSDAERLFDIPNRAFVDGAVFKDGVIRLYYRASMSAEKGFWGAIVKDCGYVTSVKVRVDPEYPEDAEELGVRPGGYVFKIGK